MLEMHDGRFCFSNSMNGEKIKGRKHERSAKRAESKYLVWMTEHI